jgi:membrane protein
MSMSKLKQLSNKLNQFFKEDLWRQPVANTSIIWQTWITLLRVSFIMVRELATGNLNLRAMSLVFTTLLSLVPLIAVTFSVLKAFGVHNQMEPMLLGFFEPLGPNASTLAEQITGFVQNMKVGVLGSVGLAMLFYTIISLVQKIESAFNYVWRVEQARSFLRRFTDYLSVVMIGPVLVFSALGVAATILNHDVVRQISAIEPFGTLLLMLSKALPFFMIVLAFTFLYKFIPNTKVNNIPAVAGAVLAGGLWITAGTLFAKFVASSSNYTAVYSSFAILFFFMIWLYLAWLILLTGSQVAFYLQHPKLVQFAGKPIYLSPRQREREGLWLMTVIAKRYCENQPPLTVLEIEEKTGLTNKMVQSLLHALQEGGMIIEVATKQPAYVPARDVAMIKVVEIFNCLRTAEEKNSLVLKNLANKQVSDLLHKVSQAQSDALGQISLRELALGDVDAATAQ